LDLKRDLAMIVIAVLAMIAIIVILYYAPGPW
jgi:hypothetical protein